VPGFDRAKQCLMLADEATTGFGKRARVETFGNVHSDAVLDREHDEMERLVARGGDQGGVKRRVRCVECLGADVNAGHGGERLAWHLLLSIDR
jgi:hypothetical protein